MVKVQVVNGQEIDGKKRKSGEVIEVSPGRARDLIYDGKAVEVAPAKKEAVKNG